MKGLIMKIIEELDNILCKAKENGEYLRKDLPSTMMAMDKEINITVESYSKLTEERKIKIEKMISIDIAWLLLCFAINMATYSLRLTEQEYFTNGLTALRIVFRMFDEREIILIMSLYYDVHKRTGLSFEKTLNYNDEFTSFISKFLRRNEDEKSLKAMGYILMKDENNNLIYQRTW